jgi:predicted Rossmann fold nucleotide-binding protein DprA/Smf involved in DNA uptake
MEVPMTRRKGKPVSFDAMVKFFIHNYNIPTKRDIDKLNDRLDRLERLIAASSSRTRRAPIRTDAAKPASATDTVLKLIRRSNTQIAFAQIRSQTGYDDKKLRNIIYRLNQMGKIIRVSRGRYKAAQ